LNRHELRQFFLQRIMPEKKALVTLSMVSALSLWCCVATLPRPLHAPGLITVKSNMKNIGTGLEMYSTDHGGQYPRELSAITPDYLKRLPGLEYMENSKDTDYYKEKYGYTGGYGYEVSSDATDYTVTVGVPPYQWKGAPVKIHYTSREGLVDEYMRKP
jgi:hypothetical protein